MLCIKALEVPVAVQNGLHQQVAAAGGLAIDGVVRAHDGAGFGVDDCPPEGWQVGVPEIVRRRRDVETMTRTLGAGVHGEVFGCCNDFEVVRVRALQAFDEVLTERCGEERVLTISLLSAAPAWIAEDVDVGRPKIKAL